MKAAENGLTDAQRELGYSYFYGKGIEIDMEKAVYWYRKAAEKEDSKALFYLGICYKFGHGVNQSLRWATYYFEKAVEVSRRNTNGKLKQLDETKKEIRRIITQSPTRLR